MSKSPEPADQQPVTPSRRDRLRPLELIGFSAVLAVFVGLIVLLTRVHPTDMHPFVFACIAAGVAFIVSVMMVALVGLGGKPSEEDLEARKDLKQKPGSDWH